MFYKYRAIFPIQGEISFQRHQNHERVEVGIVFYHLALQLQEVGYKILAIHDGDSPVHHVFDLGPVTFGHPAVDGFHRLRDMQLAAHPRHVDAVPVVDAVGGVAGLLDLGHHDARAERMDTTCRDEKHIVFLHLLVVEHRLQLIVFQYVGIVHSRHLAVEAHDEFGVFVGLHHIPHLGLAVAQTALLGQLVIGMHLHREPVVGVDDLQQERELLTIFVEDRLPHQVAHESLHQVVDLVALEVAIGDFALLIPNAREQPHLAAVRQRTVVHTQLLLDFAAAPDFIFKDGFEFQGI